jgi:ABC-type transporter Mla MlaB component
VKRISSTARVRRPKQGVEQTVPEIPVAPKSEANALAPAAGAVPAPAPVVAAMAGRIVLGASCTIHEAQQMRTQLLAQAELPGPYEIDGSAVQQVDTAGVQLVVAFALDCLERNIAYAWKGRSAALDDAIRVLGVGALLESPV